MTSGERRARRAIVAATGAVLAALMASDGSHEHCALAADRTFNISLVGQLNPLTTGPGTTNNIYADLWADGNLVALGSVSTGSGVTIIDNSNPALSVMVSRYSPAGNANGQFRDVVVRNGIGYFAIDSSTTGGPSTIGGVHIVNLANPAAPAKIAEINVPQGFQFNHDLFLDSNFLYIADNRNAIIKVFNVANPAAPTFVRNITTAGLTTDNLHDMTVVNGRMYTANIDNGITQIYDVSNLSATVAPTLLGQIDVGTRNHSTWPSADGNLLAIGRETQGGEVQLWNISNPAAPSLISSILPAPLGIDSFSAHNAVIVGDALYVSWYQAGLQVFNIRNPAAPLHLGAYDTFVGGDGNPGSFAGFDGNWGLDVSGGPSKILLSDFDNGLFTVNANDAFRQVWTYNGGPLWWQDNTRWDGGTGPYPNSSEMTAAFVDPSAGATRTVFIEGTLQNPRAASIEFLSSLSYTLEPSNGGEIEMLASSGPAKITVNAGGATAGVNRINAVLDLKDDLLVTNNAALGSGSVLELGAIRATNRTLTFGGTGETALIAANPNFSGSIALTGGRLTLRHGQATNAQPITVSGGTLVLRNDASTNFGSDVTFTGTAFLAVANGGAGSGMTHLLDDVAVNSGANVQLARTNGAHLAAGDVSIAGTLTITPQPNGPNATRFDTLAIAPGGKLNLTNAPLIVASTPVGAVETFIRSGHNGGAWDGSGVVTNQSDALTGLTTLGVATADQTGHTTFGGLSVAGDDVLVMYTYAGDANLDGAITGDDYSTIDFNIAVPSASGYFNGDFNYDGTISGDDYSVIDFNIAAQGAPFPTAGSAAVAVVPEPASACGFALFAVRLIGCRRRRSKSSK